MMCSVLTGILWVALAASPGHAEPGALALRSSCGEEAVLKCGAAPEPGLRYRDVRWYKFADGPQSPRTGLVRKNLRRNSTRSYMGLERPVSLLEDSSDLVMFNTTAQDSGYYSCLLSAPAGHKNQEVFIHLTVSGCLEDMVSRSTDQQAWSEDLWLEIILFLAVALSLVICFICWVCLRNLSILREGRKPGPIAKKTLKLIYLPGPKGPSYHHVCV